MAEDRVAPCGCQFDAETWERVKVCPAHRAGPSKVVVKSIPPMFIDVQDLCKFLGISERHLSRNWFAWGLVPCAMGGVKKAYILEDVLALAERIKAQARGDVAKLRGLA